MGEEVTIRDEVTMGDEVTMRDEVTMGDVAKVEFLKDIWENVDVLVNCVAIVVDPDVFVTFNMP
jgi:hypothetical protein